MEDPIDALAESQELIDVLIAISVVSRRLARKLEKQRKEKNHEQDRRTDHDAG